MRVLALDTSTEACSAAVLLPDGRLALRCVLTERSHADLVLTMVDEVLQEAGLRLMDLDGIAFGCGPGGFTGLRIAAGVAQGLAFGATLPVARVSSLAAVAYLCAATVPTGEGILVCNDARMNELYWACYRFDATDDRRPVPLSPERVGPAGTVEPKPEVRHCAGNGLLRHPELAARLVGAGLRHHAGVYPRADAVARIGGAMLLRGEGVRAGEALPTYVRDEVARPPAAAP